MTHSSKNSSGSDNSETRKNLAKPRFFVDENAKEDNVKPEVKPEVKFESEAIMGSIEIGSSLGEDEPIKVQADLTLSKEELVNQQVKDKTGIITAKIVVLTKQLNIDVAELKKDMMQELSDVDDPDDIAEIEGEYKDNLEECRETHAEDVAELKEELQEYIEEQEEELEEQNQDDEDDGEYDPCEDDACRPLDDDDILSKIETRRTRGSDYSESSGSGLAGIVGALVVAGIVLIIGVFVFQNVAVEFESAASTSNTTHSNIENTAYDAFELATVAMVVLGAAMVLGVLMKAFGGFGRRGF